MLGKQWLNRYASIDVRGSAIERSQNRQRKLDGIVAWYFDHAMESLPLMLQAALLLLGCALSRYLWEADTTVASVVVGVTLLGVLFYLFIVAAGATSESCPYQTPWTNVVRRAVDLSHSAYALFIERSNLHDVSVDWWSGIARRSAVQITTRTLIYPRVLLTALAMDAFILGRATFRSLVDFADRARRRLFGTTPASARALNDQGMELDFRCIYWMLRTSLDKITNVSTLNYLETILTLPGIDSAVVVDCFNIFSNCVVVDNRHVATVSRGSEQLAEISATCFLRAFSSLWSREPTSSVLIDVRQRCNRVFSSQVDLRGHPCHITVGAIHDLFAPRRSRSNINWGGYNPSTNDLIPFARALAQAAHAEYHRGGRGEPKVPRWLVRFALRFLSQDPLPPISVVVDCLTIVATDMGCNVPDTDTVVPDEECVYTSKMTVSPLILRQCTA